MTATLLVRHIARSTLAGTTGKYGGEVVRIGRNPDNDVVFDSHRDGYVSSRHAVIRRTGEAATITDLGSSNGTYVNGVRLEPNVEIPLRAGDDIWLGGEFGPLLRADVAPLDGPPTRPSLRPDEVDAPTNPAPYSRRSDSDQRSDPNRSVGRDTMKREIASVAAKERRRTSRLLIVVFVFVAAGGVATYFYKPTDTIHTRVESHTETRVEVPASQPATRPDRQERLMAVLNGARDSVYVVIERREDSTGHRSERPFGTAWSAAPGLLATNCHVAEEIVRSKGGATFVARSGANPPVDLALAGTRLHPGHAEYMQLRQRYTRGMELERFDVLKGGCDVALLEIGEGDHGRQAPPLPLATDDELRALDQNAPVGYVGFPMEGRGINWARPAPVTAVGAVTTIADFFLGTASFARAELIGMSAEAGGGASGSPVLASDGKVVCILHAVDLKQIEGRRLKTAGGQTYGQRVNILRELMDGDVEEAHAPRSAAWAESFRALFRAANVDFFSLAQMSAAKGLLNAGALQIRGSRELSDLWEEIEASDRRLEATGEGSTSTVEFTPPESAIYLMVAIPVSEPADLDISETSIPGLKDTRDDFIPYVVERLTKGRKFTAKVANGEKEPKTALDVRVKVYRLKK